MKTPPVVPRDWLAVWQEMLAKEKEFTRARDALAAARRRMPGRRSRRSTCSTGQRSDDPRPSRMSPFTR